MGLKISDSDNFRSETSDFIRGRRPRRRLRGNSLAEQFSAAAEEEPAAAAHDRAAARQLGH
ncbi:MAG TPA: hypothetical protein VIP46_07755, partial [Pyrinomonadaceae bacterium]